MNVSNILDTWNVVYSALGLAAPVQGDAHHAELLEFVDECFERFGADEHHPIFTLVNLVADRIREYEAAAHPWPDNSTPATRLAFLMEQHGLRQSDLPEVGAQSVVSDVLHGRRSLNLRQVKALAQRFAVPMEDLVG